MGRKRMLTALLVLTLCFIWGNSLLSREVSGRISDTVMFWMNDVARSLGLGEDTFTVMRDTDGDGEAEPSSALIRKAAHVIEFAVLGALLLLRLENDGRRRFLAALALGIAAAAVDETLQIFSHRGSLLSDVGIDAAGVLLGSAAAMLISRTSRKNRKQPASD